MERGEERKGGRREEKKRRERGREGNKGRK